MKTIHNSQPWKDRDTLNYLYHDREMSMGEIADRVGVDKANVYYWMDKLDVESRTKSEAIRGEKNPQEKGDRSGRDNPMYGITGEDHPAYGITRDEETRSKISRAKQGENNPNWKGGVTSNGIYRGPDWAEQREKALERDGHKCQICGRGVEDIGRNPDVHHIVPYGDFDDHEEANRLDNLISLCPSHHGKVEKGDLEVAT